jgi:hypothetical protein
VSHLTGWRPQVAPGEQTSGFLGAFSMRGFTETSGPTPGGLGIVDGNSRWLTPCTKYTLPRLRITCLHTAPQIMLHLVLLASSLTALSPSQTATPHAPRENPRMQCLRVSSVNAARHAQSQITNHGHVGCSLYGTCMGSIYYLATWQSRR